MKTKFIPLKLTCLLRRPFKSNVLTALLQYYCHNIAARDRIVVSALCNDGSATQLWSQHCTMTAVLQNCGLNTALMTAVLFWSQRSWIKALNSSLYTFFFLRGLKCLDLLAELFFIFKGLDSPPPSSELLDSVDFLLSLKYTLI